MPERNCGMGRDAARLPDFIGVGPPRTGTTWLHRVLAYRACLPKHIKETFFFDAFYDKGLDWYSSYFQCDTKFTLAGELAPTYFSSPEARERIARHLPNCRIICTLRDPVERGYSAYRLLVLQGRTRRNFEEEIMQPGSWIFEGNRYAFHLREWQKLFGASNVGIFFYDDLKADEQAYADSVCRFIGVPPVDLLQIEQSLTRNSSWHRPWSFAVAKRSHRFKRWLKARRADQFVQTLARTGVWKLLREGRKEFPPLDPQVETRIRALFLREVEALEELSGRNLAAWKRSKVTGNSTMDSAPAKAAS